VFLKLLPSRGQDSLEKQRRKIYFYDTGRVCSLLGILTVDQLALHPLRGSLFECLVVAELLKKRANAGKQVDLYYWRDKTGHEVDVIIDNGINMMPIEIKLGKTVNVDFFKNLTYWNKLSELKKGVIAYAGEQEEQRSNGIDVLNWFSLIKSDI
jgi:predicted AAA+ superfamily ATPase